MSSKKRNIYIGIIVACVIAIFAVISLSQPNISDDLLAPTPDAAAPTEQLSSSQSMSGVSVFPQNINFDLSIFETNARFRTLRDYQTITVNQSDLGRDNPFVPY